MDWEPAHADHSIDSVNLLFTFANPVDSDSFDDLIIPLRKAASIHKLTNRIEAQDAPDIALPTTPGQSVMINFGTMPTTRRVAFQQVAENAIISEFSIGVGSCSMMTVRYRRWANFFSELGDLFQAVDSAWPISENVKSIKLQYVDRFISIPGGASHFEVLAESNPKFLVVPQSDPMAAFHVHTGWFDYDSEQKSRFLTNVNIDAGDVRQPQFAGAQRNMTFLTLMQSESLGPSLENPLAQADILHQRLKGLFRQLISKAAAARVGLSE